MGTITESDLYRWCKVSGNCLRALKSPGSPWVMRLDGPEPITRGYVSFEGSGDSLAQAMRDLLSQMEYLLGKPEIQLAISGIGLP
jgi:hypothetical protein